MYGGRRRRTLFPSPSPPVQRRSLNTYEKHIIINRLPSDGWISLTVYEYENWREAHYRDKESSWAYDKRNLIICFTTSIEASRLQRPQTLLLPGLVERPKMGETVLPIFFSQINITESHSSSFFRRVYPLHFGINCAQHWLKIWHFYYIHFFF